MPPDVGFRAVAVLADALELAVGEREEVAGHGRAERGGGAVVGEVVAGEPEVVILGLALGPRLRRQVRVALHRMDEDEASARLGRVAHAYAELLAIVIVAVEADVQLLALAPVVSAASSCPPS